MDILRALERCIGETRVHEAVSRYIHRQETLHYLTSIGRDSAGLPAPYHYEHDLQLLESLAAGLGPKTFFDGCLAFRDFVTHRETLRREAMLQAENAAHEFLLRSSPQ